MKVNLTFYEEWAEWTAKKAKALSSPAGLVLLPAFVRDVAQVGVLVARQFKNPFSLLKDPLKPVREHIQAMYRDWQ